MKKLLLAVLTLVALQTQAQNSVGESQRSVQCWKHIEFGMGHALGLKNDGTLWSWGNNDSGELGDGTTVDKLVPAQIGAGASWKAISAGYSMNLALKSDGTMWVWGNNYYGQIAGGSNPQTTPLQVGIANDWKTIASGDYHMLAIKEDGTLWVWGYNGYGAALGLGSDYENVASPTQLGTANDWVAIATGHYSSYAIKSNGTLWAWGWNNVGQIGNGAMDGNSSGGPDVVVPTQIGADTDWKMVDPGGQHVIAQKNDNTLWSWGACSFGELGDGSFASRSTPQQMSSDTWLSFSAGNGTSSGVKTNGKLYRWGFEAGIGNMPPAYAPVEIGTDTDWSLSLATGQSFYCAAKSDGEIYMRGSNSVGQLGLGDTVNHPELIFFDTMCVVTAGLNDNTLAPIVVYPNPTATTLTLANAENLRIEKLQVIDVAGKTIITQNSNNTQLDVQQLPAGMYFLRISAKEGVQYLKFIKE
jgi:alpha-tubulin suppressor-like RCC1 family protein